MEPALAAEGLERLGVVAVGLEGVPVEFEGQVALEGDRAAGRA